MLLDVRPDHLKVVLNILRTYVPNAEVFAFGSRAKWTAKDSSDLDLCVRAGRPLGFGLMGDLLDAFSESSLPYKVDVVDWESTSPAFRKIIEADKVPVYSDEEEQASGVMATEYGQLSALLNRSKLEDLCEKGGVQTGPFGSQLHKEDYVDDGIPIITVEHLGENRLIHENLPRVSGADYQRLSKYRLNQGDIVFSRVGSVDRRALVQAQEDGWLFSGRCLRVRPDPKKIDSTWLSYFFGMPSFKEYIRGIAVGATMPSLNTKILSDVPIYFPPLDKQKEIGEILVALDDKIALLRETNITLEAIAQALFKSWFVDFDPVRAKAEGCESEGVPPEVAELFPSEFEDSEIGEIPKGWSIEPFGKLLGHAIGGDWGKDNADDEHTTAVAIVRGTDIPDIRVGNLDGVPRRFVSPKKLKSRRLQDGDLIIEVSGGSKTQATGRSLYCTDGLLDDFGMPVVPASFCRLFRPADQHIGILLAIHLSSIYAAGKMWNYQVQSTGLANFQTTHFLESELVVVPSEPIREAFFDCVRPLIERQQTADIRTTASLRDALLPRLMSGQLNQVESDA